MPIQAATIRDLLQHRIDCLGQAKTGTGKTLAFLVPAIQTLLSSRRPRASPISTLVIAPTRELVLQIAQEARSLTQRLPQCRVGVAIGGTNKNTEAARLRGGCEILVATPGRLLDHMQEEYLTSQFNALQTLVLDEADRMLDIGFLPDLKKIISHLPSKSITPRQSMLFSATITDDIRKVATLALNRDYKFTSTIDPEETNTHERVPQELIITPSISLLAPAMIAVAKRESYEAKPFKAIIFAPTAAQADLYGILLDQVAGLPPTSIMHSRKSQSVRTRTSDAFRKATSAICVATDVIARGMDFPGVTHVLQVGLPSDREAYIHRIGRTGRAGAEGRGILILSAAEKFFPRIVRGVQFQEYPTLAYNVSDIEPIMPDLETRRKAYSALLGFYKSHLKALQWSTTELVQQANAFALEGMQCPEVPGLQKKTIGMMNLRGVPGLVVQPNEPGANKPQRGGDIGGRRRGHRQ